MLTLIDNSKRWQIIKFFLDNPTLKVHLRSLAKRLGISTTWIAKSLPSLEKAGFLSVARNQETRLLTIYANRDDLAFKRLKLSSNLFYLHESGLLDKLISLYNKPESIILFGSYRKGEDTEESDIDLAVITALKLQFDWAPFEKKLHRKIRVLELKKGKIEAEFKSTLANGIVLYGYLDLKT
ncbi:MAG TPA: nucleotidyltransferase domain-containing protein [Candidatus Nanoarchaeia archaeon]|nr:nucleotidyltransferase domain-containing protein [Candidatus Nanoarchaeia archaeon]